MIFSASLSLAIWPYLVFARGGFWRVWKLRFKAEISATKARVVAVIPARDEADVPAESLTSLHLGGFTLILSARGLWDLRRKAAPVVQGYRTVAIFAHRVLQQ